METRPLRPHQQIGFHKFQNLDCAAFLMEMRLGKTLLAIRWAMERTLHLNCPRILVIAPLTPLSAWMDELELEKICYHLYLGTKRTGSLSAKGWKLTSYDTLIRSPELLSQEWDCCILDESTAIKSPRAKTTKLILKKIAKKSRCRAILTGEIEPEGLQDIWTQMAFVYGGQWMGCSNFWDWQRQNFYKAGFEWKAKAGRHQFIKELVHSQAYVLTKKEAGLEPQWVREKITEELDPSARSEYNNALATWQVPGLTSKHIIVVVSWIRQICGGHLPGGPLECWKYAALLSILETSDSQCVVWFCFRSELKRAWHLCREKGIPVTYINGDTPVDQRRKRILEFRKGNRKVFLCIARCGRFGMDLSTASTEVYFSSPYSYEDRRQSEERLATVSQNKKIKVIDLVSANTIDEEILEALKDKRSNAEWFSRKFMEKHSETTDKKEIH